MPADSRSRWRGNVDGFEVRPLGDQHGVQVGPEELGGPVGSAFAYTCGFAAVEI